MTRVFLSILFVMFSLPSYANSFEASVLKISSKSKDKTELKKNILKKHPNAVSRIRNKLEKNSSKVILRLVSLFDEVDFSKELLKHNKDKQLSTELILAMISNKNKVNDLSYNEYSKKMLKNTNLKKSEVRLLLQLLAKENNQIDSDLLNNLFLVGDPTLRVYVSSYVKENVLENRSYVALIKRHLNSKPYQARLNLAFAIDRLPTSEISSFYKELTKCKNDKNKYVKKSCTILLNKKGE